MPKLPLLKNYNNTILPMKRLIPLPMDICPKVNMKARLEFELVSFETAIQHFSYYTTGTSNNISLERNYDNKSTCLRLF